MAQNLEMDKEQYPAKLNYANTIQESFAKKAIETSWMSPLSMLADRGATFTNPSFFPLFQDSSLVFVPSDGGDPFRVSWHLFGTFFDPTDPFYSLQTGGWQASRFHSYEVDSVRFPMSYIRQVDSIMMDGSMTEVVDTLIIHLYEPDAINTWFFNNGSDEVFALPNNDGFSVKELGPTDVNFTDTILLTREMATDTSLEESINLARVSIPVQSMTIGPNADNTGSGMTAGFSLVFKSMIPFEAGDTLLSYDDNIKPSKLFNVFGTGSYTNSGARVPLTTYNNSFVTNFQVRYGQDFDPFRGYLATLSSVGWANDFYFDGDFYVTADVNSVENMSNTIEVAMYPNPVAAGEHIYFDIKDKSINGAQVLVTDILGNIVDQKTLKNVATEQSVSTEGFANGFYFLKIVTEKGNFTSKFTVVD